MSEMPHDHILVIGARGAVGGGAAQFLAATEGVRFAVSSSTQAGADALASRYGVAARVLDLGDPTGLAQALAGHRHVVQAAGPAGLVGDRVCTAALAAGSLVVDVTGGELYAGVAAGGEGRCIHSAGVYPGLTEVWADHVISTSLDECQRVEIYLAGNGGFSATGNLDVLASLADGTTVAMAHLVAEQTVVAAEGVRSVVLPPPVGRVRALPVVGPGLRALAARRRIGRAVYYNTFSDSAALEQMMAVRAELDAGALPRDLAVRMSAHNPPAGQDGHCMVFVSAHGRRGGTPARADGAILLPTDWNTGSGWVAAATLLALRAGAGSGGSSPVCSALDAVDPAAVIEALVSHGARCRIAAKEVPDDASR